MHAVAREMHLCAGAAPLLSSSGIPRGPLRPRQPAEDRQRWQDDVAPDQEQQ